MVKRILKIVLMFVTLCLQISIMHAADNEYILPQSASTYLTENDVVGFSKQELNYARNEIYARHGRRFKSQELMNYFNTTDWYVGTIEPENFDEAMLNEFERTNAYFLSDLEYGDNTEGYVLDQPGYDIYKVTIRGMNESGASAKGAKLTEGEAYDAVYKYLDEKIGMTTVYDYHGFLVSADHTDEEYIFWFRSYTSAHAYYYVNKYSGDVYESQENPIVLIYEEKTYIFNALGEEAAHDEVSKEKYELMHQDGVYYAGMISKYYGNLTGSPNTIYATVYDYSYEDNIFVLSGSLNTCEMDESAQTFMPKFDKEHIMFNKVRGFVCNEDTQFIALSGEDQRDVYSPEEFVAYAITCKDTGLGLILEVNNGILTSVKIAS